MIQPAAIRTLLCYWELRIGHYLPTAILLLEDMKAAVRLSDFFAILRAFGGSAVRHHDNVGAKHLELILVWRSAVRHHDNVGAKHLELILVWRVRSFQRHTISTPFSAAYS